MIRGETQYNKMSRFLKEIPMELLSTGAVFQKPEPEEERKPSAYQQARQAFRAKSFCTAGSGQKLWLTKRRRPGIPGGRPGASCEIRRRHGNRYGRRRQRL